MSNIRFRTILVTVGLTVISLLPLSWYFLRHLNAFAGYDWDWFFSHYEAVRQSILVYHQFPWWNPWSTGGIPLFADPQVGVVSITTMMVLIFGTVWGVKLSLVLHYGLGLWGMYFLIRRLQRQPSRTIPWLLSVLWIYSGFTIFHSIAGHVSFWQYLLAPWGLLTVLVRRRKFWWLRAGVFWGLYVLAVPHYIVVQVAVLVIPILGYELLRLQKSQRRKFLVNVAMVGLIVLVISGSRVWYASVYVHQFVRGQLIEPISNLAVALFAFFQHEIIDPEVMKKLANWEYHSFVGISFAIFFITAFVFEIRNSARMLWYNIRTTWPRRLHQLPRTSAPSSQTSGQSRFWLFVVIGLCCTIIAFGPFARYAPYRLLQHLPFFSIMQVPTRWFGWSVFFAILAAGTAVIPKPKILQLFLIGAAMEVVIGNISFQPNVFLYRVSAGQLPQTSTFQQYSYYPGPLTHTSNMFFAMRNGYGEIRSYEPVIDYNFFRPTHRCGINEGCPLSTGGAVTTWSPNVIIVQGQPGDVVHVNSNDSTGWLLNDRKMNTTTKVFDNTKDISATLPSDGRITLRYSPTFAWAIYASLFMAALLAVLEIVVTIRLRGEHKTALKKSD